MVTGFSTERTAEYIVLHDLYERIKDQYSLFYPFFYQKNRDDTQLSADNQIEELHLVTCFARRPKTNIPNSPYSMITFRSSIFEHTNYFSELGISTIVGAPIGTSVNAIGFGSKCNWFQIFPTQDVSYIVSEFIDGETCSANIDFISILDCSKFKSLIRQAPKYSWNEILTIVQTWNYKFKLTHPTTLFKTIPGQKPVFIVYK